MCSHEKPIYWGLQLLNERIEEPSVNTPMNIPSIRCIWCDHCSVFSLYYLYILMLLVVVMLIAKVDLFFSNNDYTCLYCVYILLGQMSIFENHVVT